MPYTKRTLSFRYNVAIYQHAANWLPHFSVLRDREMIQSGAVAHFF